MTTSTGRDIYESPLAREQLRDDALDYRRSLYTNTKDDHPANWLTGEPCGCERGDDTTWERHGFKPGGPFMPGSLQPEYDPCGPGLKPPQLEAGQ